MYGYIGCFSGQAEVSSNLICDRHDNVKCIENSISTTHFSAKQLTPDKFANDKVFYSDSDIIIIIEGVIYNFEELTKKHSMSRAEVIKHLYNTGSAKHVADELNGYYSGVIYDIKANKIILIEDHISYKPVYYCKLSDSVWFSTDIDWLYRTLAENGFSLTLNSNAAYCLLNHGYMIGNSTMVEGVYKLLAGNIIEYDRNMSCCMYEYFYNDIKFSNITKAELTKEEYDNILDNVDRYFSNAVKLVYDKDDEYRYKHIGQLSGGLDSRIVILMALRLGYRTTCLTMGKSNCNDIRISSEIASMSGLEHFIFELDSNDFMLDLDAAVRSNGGTIGYLGFSHSFRLLSVCNFDKYGAVHTGDLGDLSLGGSYSDIQMNHNVDIFHSMYGKGEFIGRFDDDFAELESKRYNNQYLFNYFNRGLNSAGNGCFATQHYTECSAPFIEKKMIKYCLELPQSIMMNHKLYIDYMKKYLPNACNFAWEKTGCKPGASKITNRAKRWQQRFQHKILHKSISMNPFDMWYAKNSAIRDCYDSIYNSTISSIQDNTLLFDTVSKRFASPSVMDKSLALTLLKTISIYNMKLL